MTNATEKLSLAPLKFKEAVSDLLKIKPEPKSEKTKRTRRPPKSN